MNFGYVVLNQVVYIITGEIFLMLSSVKVISNIVLILEKRQCGQQVCKFDCQ